MRRMSTRVCAPAGRARGGRGGLLAAPVALGGGRAHRASAPALGGHRASARHRRLSRSGGRRSRPADGWWPTPRGGRCAWSRSAAAWTVASALGDGQIRHLTWIDDRRVIFEDGGAPARWQLLDLGDRRPSAVAVAHADRHRRDQRHDAASQRAPAGRGEPRRRVDRRPGRRQRRAGAVARAARRPGAVEDRDHDRPGGVAGVDVAPGRSPASSPAAEGSRISIPCGGPTLATTPAARHRREHRLLGRRHRPSTRRPPTSAASSTCGGSSGPPVRPPA